MVLPSEFFIRETSSSDEFFTFGGRASWRIPALHLLQSAFHQVSSWSPVLLGWGFLIEGCWLPNAREERSGGPSNEQTSSSKGRRVLQKGDEFFKTGGQGPHATFLVFGAAKGGTARDRLTHALFFT